MFIPASVITVPGQHNWWFKK